MQTRDELIGANLQRLRMAGTSQQALADAMKERGWKWSQATVWSVEKGERPIRLAEALDLVDIFGLDGIGELTTTPIVTVGWQRLGIMDQRHQQLAAAADAYLQAQFDLALIADQLEQEGLDLPGVEEDEVERHLETTPEQVLAEVEISQRPGDRIELFEQEYPKFGEFANGAKYVKMLIAANPEALDVKERDSDGEHQATA